MSGEHPGLDIQALTALAEPNRMRIVELLCERPRTVGEIAEQLGLRQPQASKHLKVLSDNRIVEVQAEANRRIYKLRIELFQALDGWLQSFRNIMEDGFDKLEDCLKEMQQKDNINP